MRFTRTRRAAVLGCGPAGLFAAHALIQRGWSVRIYSKKRRSEMFGAQYLHAPIPGLTDDAEPVLINYKLQGSVEGYRDKVYGRSEVRTSVEVLETSHHAWDIRAAYYRAYEEYEELIVDQQVTPEFLGVTKWDDVPDLRSIRLITHQFHLIVNSIPADRLCYQPDSHRFHATKIWAMGDAPERGIRVPFEVPDNTVICNGDRDTGWYRASRVFGHSTVEWPGKTKPPLQGVAEVVKPIASNCFCYMDQTYNFVPVGRYGTWQKGVLSHHAYERAFALGRG